MSQSRSSRFLLLVPLVLLSVTALAACGDSDDSSSATTTAKATTTTTAPAGATGDVAVKVASTDLGKVLVNPDGMTLYAFTPDTATTSACTGACADAWPPATTISATPKGDAVTGAITVIKRDDGTSQVVVAGHPLYGYSGDAAAGDTTGQGSGGKWYVVSPDGSLIKAAAAADSTTTTAAKTRY
jgi:predicted lipoprotein with Yx(FWY)xxD motif